MKVTGLAHYYSCLCHCDNDACDSEWKLVMTTCSPINGDTRRQWKENTMKWWWRVRSQPWEQIFHLGEHSSGLSLDYSSMSMFADWLLNLSWDSTLVKYEHIWLMSREQQQQQLNDNPHPLSSKYNWETKPEHPSTWTKTKVNLLCLI